LTTHPASEARGRRALYLAAVLALSLPAACDRTPAQGGAPAGPGAGGPPPAMPVAVLEARMEKVPNVVEAVGTLEGLREVEVRARVAGVLQKQMFREGEPVRAGAPLYQIERAPYEIARDAARATVAQQEARVEQARRENARLASLISDRAISQREADDASSTLKTAEAALLAARAQLRDAELNVGYTQVTAPIAGIAQRSQRSEGTLVSPAADGGLLTTIVQTHPIRVRFALAPSEAAQVRSGGGKEVHLLGPDGRPSKEAGRLDYAGSMVDPRLGTVQMRAELPNPSGQWLPGQFVRVQITAGDSQGFVVPQSAVMSGEQGRFVWVVGPEGKATPKPVQTGSWRGADWILRGGLDVGDQVITNNLMKMRPGAPVQPAPATGPAAPASAATASAPAGPADAASRPAN
jgi:membrane fusion protein (multidrug efflux system)